MNWKTLQILNDIYINRFYDSNYLVKTYYGKTLVKSGLISSDGKIKLENYDSLYKQRWKEEYDKLESFLSVFDLLNSNFELDHINALHQVWKDKETLLEQNTSLKEISTRYFGSAKKVKTNSQLYKAVLNVLEVSSLKRDEHDQQYLLVLHAINKKPKAVVLCENDNMLKKPRLQDVELWYAGGNNTAKLEFVAEPALPIYYLCDWDSNGLEIYQRIKRTYFPAIEIIIPDSPVFKELKDNQKWKVKIDRALFSPKALKLIDFLCQENKWVEEESIKFRL